MRQTTPSFAGNRCGEFRRWLALLAALIAVGFIPRAPAQEGHPLKGSWIGTWESNETHGDDVLVILDWDGKNITGMINPGTDNMAITKANLAPEGWVVTLEADGKDKAGAAVHYVIEGRIEDLELPNRSIVGTWRNERGRGAFEISRQ
jgi:hypothetical protein